MTSPILTKLAEIEGRAERASGDGIYKSQIANSALTQITRIMEGKEDDLKR